MKKHAQRDILLKVIRAVAIVNPSFFVYSEIICLFARGTTDAGFFTFLQGGCVHLKESCREEERGRIPEVWLDDF